MSDISTLLNMGRFDDDNHVNAEIEMDVEVGSVQTRRSVFYDRSYGTSSLENRPGGISLVIGLRHEIAAFVAHRNLSCGDGTNGTVDRRALTSQNLIQVTQNQNGDTIVRVTVIPMRQQAAPSTLVIPIGGT